jgi:hypothetical protein
MLPFFTCPGNIKKKFNGIGIILSNKCYFCSRNYYFIDYE